MKRLLAFSQQAYAEDRPQLLFLASLAESQEGRFLLESLPSGAAPAFFFGGDLTGAEGQVLYDDTLTLSKPFAQDLGLQGDEHRVSMTSLLATETDRTLWHAALARLEAGDKDVSVALRLYLDGEVVWTQVRVASVAAALPRENSIDDGIPSIASLDIMNTLSRFASDEIPHDTRQPINEAAHEATESLATGKPLATSTLSKEASNTFLSSGCASSQGVMISRDRQGATEVTAHSETTRHRVEVVEPSSPTLFPSMSLPAYVGSVERLDLPQIVASLVARTQLRADEQAQVISDLKRLTDRNTLIVHFAGSVVTRFGSLADLVRQHLPATDCPLITPVSLFGSVLVGRTLNANVERLERLLEDTLATIRERYGLDVHPEMKILAIPRAQSLSEYRMAVRTYLEAIAGDAIHEALPPAMAGSTVPIRLNAQKPSTTPTLTPTPTSTSTPSSLTQGASSSTSVAHPRTGLTLTQVIDLADALTNDFQGFTLYVQLQVDARRLTYAGAECLVRLAQPGLDIGPAQFVPYLESGPLSLAFGRRVAEMAVEAGKRFQRVFEKAKEEGSASDTSTLADDTGLFRLSFNVSPRQMADHFWVPFLSSTLAQAGLTGEAFELELTETSRALSTERLAAWIEACRCLGLTWALDDFGTGYNGIDVMLKGHFDTVKFDRAFLCQALSDADAEAFLAHLIEACRTSGAAICLEGIENVDIWQRVERFGADAWQGFLFARPLPLPEALALWRRGVVIPDLGLHDRDAQRDWPHDLATREHSTQLRAAFHGAEVAHTVLGEVLDGLHDGQDLKASAQRDAIKSENKPAHAHEEVAGSNVRASTLAPTGNERGVPTDGQRESIHSMSAKNAKNAPSISADKGNADLGAPLTEEPDAKDELTPAPIRAPHYTTIAFRPFIALFFVPMVALLLFMTGLFVTFNSDIETESTRVTKEAVMRIMNTQSAALRLEALRSALSTLSDTADPQSAQNAYHEAKSLLTTASLDRHGETKAGMSNLLGSVETVWAQRQAFDAKAQAVDTLWQTLYFKMMTISALSAGANPGQLPTMEGAARELTLQTDAIEAMHAMVKRAMDGYSYMCSRSAISSRLAFTDDLIIQCRQLRRTEDDLHKAIDELGELRALFGEEIASMDKDAVALEQHFADIEARDLISDIDVVTQLTARYRPWLGALLVAVILLVVIAGFGIFAVMRPIDRLLKALHAYRQEGSKPGDGMRSRIREFNDLISWLRLFVELTDQEQAKRTAIASKYTELLTEAHRDSLTGVANRRALQEALTRGVALLPDTAVLMIDIDHFKVLNDTRGHLFGDRILARMGEVLRRNVSHKDNVYRYGGEEFCVVLTGVSPMQAQSVANRLLTRVRRISRLTAEESRDGESATPMTISIGISSVTTRLGEVPLETLIAEADQALYRAKALGRNRTQTFVVSEATLAKRARRGLRARSRLSRRAGKATTHRGTLSSTQGPENESTARTPSSLSTDASHSQGSLFKD